MLKQELTTSSYSIKGRLRLFHGTMTPTIMYGTVSWTMTQELEKLRRTQRQTLRMIVNRPRRRQHSTSTVLNTSTTTQNTTTPTTIPNTTTTTPTNITNITPQNYTSAPTLHIVENSEEDQNNDSGSNPRDVDSIASEPTLAATVEEDEEALEPWVDWIRRCTHEAEKQIADLGIDDWVSIHRRRKWRWAHFVAIDQNSKSALKALTWDPTLDPRYNPTRRRGRPQTRWTDDLVQHVTTSTQSTEEQSHTDNNDNDDNTHDNDGDNDPDHGGRNNETNYNENYDRRLTWAELARDTQRWMELEDSFVKRGQQR